MKKLPGLLWDFNTQQTGGKEGGGIALIFGRNNKIKLLENGNTPTIEYAMQYGDIPSGINQYTYLESTIHHQIANIIQQMACYLMISPNY